MPISESMKKITLISASSTDQEASIRVLQTMNDILLPAKSIFFSDTQYNIPNIESIKISRLNSIIEYGHFIANELVDYIDTDFCFIVHHDGYVIDINNWTDEFLNYDFIGAPWPFNVMAWNEKYRLGNGGFCIRSTRMMKAYKKILQGKKYDVGEDIILCVMYRDRLEELGFSFAPIELAAQFSFEHQIPERTCKIEDCFGFHDFKTHPELKEKYKHENHIYFSI